ncbi:MAG: hypothetical protein IKZ48_05745 [Prevotella sp.]|nr:hypothetical protein [Prevotella sp.]
MKNFLIASVLTMAINQLNTTVDGIIVSHLVGPDALSAVTLYIPVNLLVTALATLLGIGATIIASKAIGRRDKEAVSGILSTALTSLIIAGICLGIVGFAFGNGITGILTNDERLHAQLFAYLSVMLGLGLFPMLNQFLGQCVDIDGFPLNVTKAMLLIFSSNILLDLLLVGALDMGIRGSAIATISSYIIAILFHCRHLFGPRSDIRFRFQVSSFRKYIRPNLIQGLPLLISNVILVVLFYSMNSIVQDRLGHNGMFVMSVCLNIFMIGMMLSNGFGSTILSLGGFLYGQSDFTSVRFLVKRCLLAILIITLGFSVLVEAYPSLLTRLFGANTPELIALAYGGVRIFIICLAPFCLALTLANLYQVLGRIALSPILVVSFPVILLSSMKLLAGYEDDSMLWYSFPVSGILVLLFAVVMSGIIRLKNRQTKLMPLTLIPLQNHDQVYEVSLKNTTDDFYKAVSELPEIVGSFKLDKTTQKQVVSSTEEMLINTIQHSGIKGNNHYSDLRMVQTDEKFIISMKYEGKPFNPLTLNEDDRRFGLKILFGLTKDVDYKYMYGQNMMYLSWDAPCT